MTRYNNPLPPNQVPNSQGRPAGSGQAGQTFQHQYEQPAWPQPNSGLPGSAGQGYGDAGSYGADQLRAGNGQQVDPYAALRPDGYGYGQPSQQQPAHQAATTADPYGLAGYTAPQNPGYGTTPARTQQAAPPPSYRTQPPPAAPLPSSSYSTSAPAPSYASQAPDPYAASRTASPYGGGTPQQGYGAAGNSYGSLSTPSSGGYGSPAGQAAPLPPAYGATSAAPPQPSYASQAAAGGNEWGGSLELDARDYGHDYQTAAPEQWEGDHYNEPPLDMPASFQTAQAQQHASFDQSYAEDDVQYEDEPRRGGGWKKVVALAACTVLLGGGLVVAYGSIMGGGDSAVTPVIKSASGPSKVKPSDPGGRQFAHAESKLMGRLGEGGVEASRDQAGVRKVPVVTVGRDGSIQAPAPETEETRAVVAVPGLTVIDGFGGGPQMPSPSRPAGPSSQSSGESKPLPVKMVSSAEDRKPAVVAPPKKSEKVAPKKERVAAVTPPAASSGPKPTGAGYVAVLASVPASGSSRIEALKQFADMQQRYTDILANKTPDVQEADLGERGTYHRLLVGPPGSRDSASSVCTQLKAQGYSGCWVTAY